MSFPADESYVYQLNANNVVVEQAIRWQFSGGLATDNTRLVTRVACNIPGASDAAIVLGDTRRLASQDTTTPEPFRSAPFSGNTHRQVTESTAPGAVTTIADYLTPSIYIGERDMYRLYFLSYLSRLDKALLRAGSLSNTDFNNLSFLYSLTSTGFVSNATLPPLPTY